MRNLGLISPEMASTIYTEICDARIKKQPIPKMEFSFYDKIEEPEYIDTSKKYKNLVINKVIEIIRDNMDYIDDKTLNAILSNISTIKIYSKKLNTPINGEYKTKGNIMVLNNLKSIYHECLHLASSEYDPYTDTSYSGFRVTNHSVPPHMINDKGVGFNEGYTQYQAIGYGDSAKLYLYEAKIASRLEKIIGKDKLKPLYFSHNLLGLCKEIEKHFEPNDAANIISGLDYISYCRSSIYLQIRKAKEIEEKKKMINLSMKRI